MTFAPLDMAELALAERFLAPAADLVTGALEDGACPVQIGALLRCLAVAASRFDPAAESDFTAALLVEATREAAIDLILGAPISGKLAS